MVPALPALRQFVLSPKTFFEERPPAKSFPLAAGVVVLFAICLAVGLSLVGAMFAGAIDATVTMDNPERPPDFVCEDEDTDSAMAENCDEPETVERDVGVLVQEEFQDYVVPAFVAPFVVWLVGGAVLWGGGRLAGGDPSGLGALSLAGWAAVPEFFRLAIGLLGLRVALSDLTITDPEQGAEAIQAAMAPVDPWLTVASLVTIGWQWYLLSGGLSAEARIPRGAAAVATGVPLALVFLLSLP